MLVLVGGLNPSANGYLLVWGPVVTDSWETIPKILIKIHFERNCIFQPTFFRGYMLVLVGGLNPSANGYLLVWGPVVTDS